MFKPLTASIQTLHFSDRYNGMIAGGAYPIDEGSDIWTGFISTTTDGGANWKTIYLKKDDDSTEIIPKKIQHFQNKLIFGISRSSKFLISIDSLENISFKKIDTINTNFSSIFFINENTGFISDYFGSIYKTNNKGLSWVKIFKNDSISLNDIYFVDDNIGYIVGKNKKNSYNIILNTNDGGYNWVIESLDSPYPPHLYSLSDIHFSTQKYGWAVGGEDNVFSTIPMVENPKVRIIEWKDGNYCDGEIAYLSVWPNGSEFSYKWSTGDTSTTISVDKGGEYKVIIKGNNYLDSAVIFLKYNPNPVVKLNVSGVLNLCKGKELILKTKDQYSQYYWHDTGKSNNIKVTKTGKYWVVVKDTNGCWGRSDTLIANYYDDLLYILDLNLIILKQYL